MSQATSKLATIERLITLAKARHQGPPLYLLNIHQRKIWDEHQKDQRKAITDFERAHGKHSWIKAILDTGNDPCINKQLPHSIRHLLDMEREHITVPIGTPLATIQQMYDDIAHPNKGR